MSIAPAQPTIETLLAEGDGYAGKGDVKAATSFYQAALKAAQARAVDPATRARLGDAANYIRQQADAYKAALKKVIEGRPGERTGRLRHAVEILRCELDRFLSVEGRQAGRA